MPITLPKSTIFKHPIERDRYIPRPTLSPWKHRYWRCCRIENYSMKLHFLDRTIIENNSFAIKENSYPYFLRIWHYHPELELVYIKKSTGTRFIGDSIERFSEGEVVLIGPNLPHMWLNDKKYFSDSSNLVAEAYAIHFKKDFLGKEFLNAPELKNVSDLIETSILGIKFVGLDHKVIALIKELPKKRSFEKLIQFLEILNSLANHTERVLLSSKGYLSSFKKSYNINRDRVLQYIFNNFNRSITLVEVAAIANMNPTAFSRYFKKTHRKTFKEYLNEIRVGYACKLLTENDYNITRICYESGYNSVSNFNRQFKKIMGIPPSEYLRQHKTI